MTRKDNVKISIPEGYHSLDEFLAYLENVPTKQAHGGNAYRAGLLERGKNLIPVFDKVILRGYSEEKDGKYRRETNRGYLNDDIFNIYQREEVEGIYSGEVGEREDYRIRRSLYQWLNEAQLANEEMKQIIGGMQRYAERPENDRDRISGMLLGFAGIGTKDGLDYYISNLHFAYNIAIKKIKQPLVIDQRN